jgi:hypothetical protein
MGLHNNKVLVILGRDNSATRGDGANLLSGLFSLGCTLGYAEADMAILDYSGLDNETVENRANQGLRRSGKGKQVEILHRVGRLNPWEYTLIILIGTQDQMALAFASSFAHTMPQGRIVHITGYDGPDHTANVKIPTGYEGYTVISTTAASQTNPAIREALGIAPKAAHNHTPQATERRPFLKAARAQGEACA